MVDWRNPSSLKQIRKAMRISVAELAAESGVSPSQIYRIESGMGCRVATATAIEEAIHRLMRAKGGAE